MKEIKETQEKPNEINLTEFEILTIENFDLKQQLYNLNQKIFQTEIQKLQNDYDNHNAKMNSYFLDLANKYNIEPDEYVINLPNKCFERKK